jgi:iron complex outermembrane receptor protein
MNKGTFRLMCSAAITASTAVQAQTASVASQRDAATASAADPDTGSSSAIADIVVTATRREERLQNVPVSVTAISANQLAHADINTSANLVQAVPALTLTRQASTATPAIRGVVSNGISVGDEPNVSFYVDGVYQPVSTANVFDLLAIDRVEVLRGPQGTLFGRNSMGGLVNIITRAPSFKPEGEASISYGRFSQWDGRAYASTGLSDKVAVSLGLQGSRNSGFDKDLVRGGYIGKQDSFLSRGKILFAPSDTIKFTGTVFYSYYRDDSVGAAAPIDGNTQARAVNRSVLVPTGPNEFTGNTTPLIAVRKFESNLAGEIDLGGVTLNTTSSYQHDYLNQRQDNDGTPIFVRYATQKQISDTYSQEVRLSSDSSGPLKWITGFFFYDLHGFVNPILIVTPASTTMLQPNVTARSEALFAEANYNITPRLQLTVGGRYTWEHRTFSQKQAGRQLFDVGVSYQNFTPRGILEYKVSRATNVYASVSTGFKSGVYAATSTNPTPVKPEKLTAYEVGIKSDPASWLRANLSSFYYDYRDVQATARGADGLVILRNAAKARIYGGELELTVRASHDLSFHVGASYIHGRYSSFSGAVEYVPLATGGNAQVIGDASGSRLVRSPDFSGSIGADYQHAFDQGVLGIGANLYHTTRVYYDFGNLVSQAPYSVLNANVSWTFSNKLTVGVWSTNLTNAHYVSSIDVGTLATQAYWQKPRSFGISVSKKF